MADSGWIETACYATVESTALLPSLPSNTLSSILFKLEKLLPLKYIICLKQNFTKSDYRAKGKKQADRPGMVSNPSPALPSLLTLASDVLKLAFWSPKMCQIVLIRSCVKGVILLILAFSVVPTSPKIFLVLRHTSPWTPWSILSSA